VHTELFSYTQTPQPRKRDRGGSPPQLTTVVAKLNVLSSQHQKTRFLLRMTLVNLSGEPVPGVRPIYSEPMRVVSKADQLTKKETGKRKRKQPISDSVVSKLDEVKEAAHRNTMLLTHLLTRFEHGTTAATPAAAALHAALGPALGMDLPAPTTVYDGDSVGDDDTSGALLASKRLRPNEAECDSEDASGECAPSMAVMPDPDDRVSFAVSEPLAPSERLSYHIHGLLAALESVPPAHARELLTEAVQSAEVTHPGRLSSVLDLFSAALVQQTQHTPLQGSSMEDPSELSYSALTSLFPSNSQSSGAISKDPLWTPAEWAPTPDCF
jgi:hypothetical protein